MTFLSKFRRQLKHVTATMSLGPIGPHNGYSDTVRIPGAKRGDLVIFSHAEPALTSLDVRAAKVDAEDGLVLVHLFNDGPEALRYDHPVTLHFLLVKGLG